MFLLGFLRDPLHVGAVTPSGRRLSAAIASQVDPSVDGPVIELGGGTGAVTQALIQRGIAPERIYSIELSPQFVRTLRERFPRVNVVEGDAVELVSIAQRLGLARPAAVVSGLPMLSFRVPTCRAILDAGLTLLGPGRPFIQFTYGPVPPVSTWSPDISVRRVAWVPLNFPPATVWRYGRRASGEAGTAPGSKS